MDRVYFAHRDPYGFYWHTVYRNHAGLLMSVMESRSKSGAEHEAHRLNSAGRAYDQPVQRSIPSGFYSGKQGELF